MKLRNMTINHWWYSLVLALVVALSVACSSPTGDVETVDESVSPPEVSAEKPEPKSPEQESVQEDVDASAGTKTDDAREKLDEEATAAVQMTREAITLLSEEEPKADEAVAELEKAVGKLELLVARKPDLALAPVAVTSRMHDVIAQIDTVEKVVKKAEDALDNGRVQEARHILEGLASEYVISTTRLPLATYPDAITAAVPLIDAGKIDEAKAKIQSALNLLIVEDTIYPLPLIRAEEMLADAEKLTEQNDRSDEDNSRLSDLLAAARNEIRLGQALGYYASEVADPLHEQIEQIESKTGGGESGSGYFDKIKQMIGDLF